MFMEANPDLYLIITVTKMANWHYKFEFNFLKRETNL